MTTEEILKGAEPYDHIEGTAVYSYVQVKEMLHVQYAANADEWFKKALIEDERYRMNFIRETVMQLKYCMPMYMDEMSYEGFAKHHIRVAEMTTGAVERLVNLITTGKADKEKKYPWTTETDVT